MLYESEKKVLEIIWKQEGIAAKEIAKLLEPAGWSKSTTYTKPWTAFLTTPRSAFSPPLPRREVCPRRKSRSCGR